MKRTICLMLGLSITAVTAWAGDTKPGELTDPVEILKKVDAACKAVKAVKYDATGSATGAMARRVGSFEASLVLSGFLQNAPEKYKFDLKFTLTGAPEPIHISGGTDNDMFYVIHHKDKKAYEDIDPAVMGQAGRVIGQIMIGEYLYPEPFRDEINAKSQELKGSQVIGGEDCYEVHVVYQSEQAPEATWCFSKKDFLPRQRVDSYTFPSGEKGTRTRTVTKVVVDPKLPDGFFKLRLPEGYTKTDDFAPNFIAPQQETPRRTGEQ